jgi:hypothetical protein
MLGAVKAENFLTIGRRIVAEHNDTRGTVWLNSSDP